MKNSRQILIRILTCIVLSGRGSCEWTNIPKGERKEYLEATKKWLSFEKEIYDDFSEYEKRMFEKRIGSIKRKEIAEFVLYWECTEVLAWCIGLVDAVEMPYYKENITEIMRVLDEQTGILPLIGNDPEQLTIKFSENHVIDNILSHAKMRDRESIEAERDRAMLWHWRAIEGKEDFFKKVPFKEIIEKTFQDPEITKAVDSMPVAPDGKDLLVGKKKKFYALSEEHMVHAMIYAGWRQKALEWVLNDESWEDTTADT